ncbi:MAG: matrixin family metalloprotease [Phycisphaerales bacterium]|nr:MAG: matrixin family metalloprotease [Phycisphaerales bacterium]
MKYLFPLVALTTALAWHNTVLSAKAPAESRLLHKAPITLTNYAPDITIRFPVPLICGRLADANITSVVVVNTSSNRDTRLMAGLTREGCFKALTELVPGENRLVIRAGNNELALTINYRPQTNPYVVRVFYLTDKSGSTEYQTPIENDPQDYRGRLDTAAKLMQTFTAERMYDLGFGRVTFNLEFDADGRVIVRTLRADEPAEFYHKMDGLELWSYAGRLIGRKMPHRTAKNLVIPAFTRFDPNTAKAYAHTALGGGSLALFGGGNLFTWPASITEAQKTFMDTTIIDTKSFFSDSVGRHTFWATASTTIGAALHELGHTLGLPHSRDPHDIMTRGFDRFNRAFTLVEPPHARRNKTYEFGDDEVAFWAPPSAAWLKFTRWLALDRKDFSRQNTTRITADQPSGDITVRSDNGIGAVVIAPGGDSAVNIPIDHNMPPPQELRIPGTELAGYSGEDRLMIRVLDTQGLSKVVNTRELVVRSFVRSWRFSPITALWSDPQAFVPVDANWLEAVAAAAASVKLARSETPYVDFLPHFPPGKRQNTAAYAVRAFTSDKPRDIRVHTGSDDALRLWLNGKLVTEVLALRPAQIDSESNTAAIKQGRNVLIAEVSQAGGGWGLYLRMDDNRGNELIITEDDRIAELAPSGAGPRAH